MNGATPPARAASTSFDRHLIASPADMALCLERTDRDDAAVVALLSAEGCADLLAASSQLTYRDARPVIGEGEKPFVELIDRLRANNDIPSDLRGTAVLHKGSVKVNAPRDL